VTGAGHSSTFPRPTFEFFSCTLNASFTGEWHEGQQISDDQALELMLRITLRLAPTIHVEQTRNAARGMPPLS
jgi:hypothetical protein